MSVYIIEKAYRNTITTEDPIAFEDLTPKPYYSVESFLSSTSCLTRLACMKELQELLEIVGYIISLCSVYERLSTNNRTDSWFEKLCQGIMDLEDIIKEHDRFALLPSDFYSYYDGLRESVVKMNSEKTDLLETSRTLRFSDYYAWYGDKLRNQEVLFIQFVNEMRDSIIKDITKYIGSCVLFDNFLGKRFFVIDEYSYDLITEENNINIKDNAIYQNNKEVCTELIGIQKELIAIQDKSKFALGEIEKELSISELSRSSHKSNNSMKELEIEKEKKIHEIHEMMNTLVQMISPWFRTKSISSIETLFSYTPSLRRYFQILEVNGVIEKREERYLWKRDAVSLAFFVSNIHAWAGDKKIPWKLYNQVFTGINIESLKTQASAAHFDNDSCDEISRLITQS